MKNLLTVVIFMTAYITSAQITITGVVKDSIGNPLEMVNIIAINQQTKKLDSYGFSDTQGHYKLNLQKNASYSIKVSYVGMKTADILLETKEIDITKDISLKEDTTLDEVNLTYKMPVVIKGDTIVYNADSFTSGREKKLGDVLQKLPGVEVNEEGEIKVEGKTVRKVMVEGKDFFDGDSKLATKNIPANAIDKVEILKNHSEVNQLRNVTDNEDNIAINIKLKEGKKNFWFGDIKAGSGFAMDESRYIANPKLFYYSPKYSLNVIANSNNIGEISFTWRDYFKFTGGFRNLGEGGTSISSSDDLSFLVMRNNQAKDITSTFGALNFSYSPTKTWDLSGFAIYSGMKTDIEQTSERNYINTNITETTNSLTQQNNRLGFVKLSTTYKPNANNNLDYDIFGKISKLTQHQNFLSSEAGTILENKTQTPFSINQNLNYYYTPSDTHIFAFEAQHLWQDKDPFYNAKLEQLSFANVLTFDTNQNIFDVSQNKRVKTNKLNAKLDYYYVLNAKSNVNISLGTTLSNQKFNSNIFQILDNGVRNTITSPSTLNNVKYVFNDFYTGFHYKFVTGIFTFNQGATLHRYLAKNSQLGKKFTNSFVKLLPDAFVKVSLKKSESLRLAYAMRVSFTDINHVAEGFVFNNYNRLYAGNRMLENLLSHNVQLNYSSFNMFNYTDVFASMNYSKKINAIKGSTEQLGINQIATSINSIFPDESIFANANFQKSFRKFKVTIGGNVSYLKLNNLFTSPQTQVATNRVSKSFTQSYRTKISSNFRDAPNFDIGYKYIVNNYDQGITQNRYYTHRPYINFDASLLKNFIFNTKFTYTNYRTENRTINNYSFWNANLSYQKKNSNWEYKMRVTNILGTKSLNQDNTVENIYNSTSSYIIQPRFAIFSITYNL